MAILTQKKIDSSHWYTPDGEPCHHQQRARGEGTRPTSLRDARKLGLYPSVTSILSILAKPGLDTWKQKEAVKATLRAPKKPEESEPYWIDRVIEEAFKQVDDAAELGTGVHDQLEKYFTRDASVPFVVDPGFEVYVNPVIKWADGLGLEVQDPEKVLVNVKHGYAGRVDCPFRFKDDGIGILDFKTRKTRPGEVISQYDGQIMQVAAYGAAYWGEENIGKVWGANVFVSTTEPGRVGVVRYSPAEMVVAYRTFTLICEIWRGIKGYDPRNPSANTNEVIGTPIEVSPPDPNHEKPLSDPKVLGSATIPFGKHKGLKLDDVPAGYLDWLRGQPEILQKNPDIADYLAHPMVKAAINQDLDREGK